MFNANHRLHLHTASILTVGVSERRQLPAGLDARTDPRLFDDDEEEPLWALILRPVKDKVSGSAVTRPSSPGWAADSVTHTHTHTLTSNRANGACSGPDAAG